MTIFKRVEAELSASPTRVDDASEAGVAVPDDGPVGGEHRGAAAEGAAPRPPAVGTVLAPGAVLEGTLRAAEPVLVAGTLRGTLEAEGTVTVEVDGRLEARVVAPELVVAGFLDGRVECAGRLEVRASGLVKGRLQVGTLRIEEGALLDGQLQMRGSALAAEAVLEAPEPAAAPPVEAPRPRKSARAESSGPPILARLGVAAGE
jgi:cytoskeletal protein CcmA (bactofilin family)